MAKGFPRIGMIYFLNIKASRTLLDTVNGLFHVIKAGLLIKSTCSGSNIFDELAITFSLNSLIVSFFAKNPIFL